MSAHAQPVPMTHDAGADALPWLAGADAEPLFCGPAPLRRDAFRARAQALAMRLPEAPAVINLCERRDHFILGFCAALLRGQTTLLPPARAPGVVADVARLHPGSYRLGDAASTLDCDIRVDLEIAGDSAVGMAGFSDVLAPTLPALVAFTSGSTGTPGAHAKTWGALVQTTAANLRALADLFGGDSASILATVPPQHMYGIEMSVLLPLLGPFSVHPGRPFWPQDIAAALAECAAPRLLVTAPVHLRALLQADVDVPPLAAIATATAPLPVELAAAAEDRFGCEVRELFGATETCVIAQRRTARDSAWRLFEDVVLHPHADGTRVERPALPQPVQLADLVEQVEVEGGRGFVLRGRLADVLEIAGKRASLADLTRNLQALAGVRDAAMLQLDPDAAGVRRLVAFIATDATLDDPAIIAALRERCDPVFLPRRIIRVERLPRNETGQLPRAALLALLGAAE